MRKVYLVLAYLALVLTCQHRTIPNNSVLHLHPEGHYTYTPHTTTNHIPVSDLPCNASSVFLPMVTAHRETTSIEVPYTGTEDITLFKSKMIVPNVPPHPIKPLTFWPGLEDQRYGTIFQPLLSIGSWAGGSSSSWYIQNSYVVLNGGYKYSTPRFNMVPGDEILFEIQVSGSTYTLTTSCPSKNVESVLTIKHPVATPTNKIFVAYESLDVGDVCTRNAPGGKAHVYDISIQTASGALPLTKSSWKSDLGGMSSDKYGPACAQRSVSSGEGDAISFFWDAVTTPWWTSSLETHEKLVQVPNLDLDTSLFSRYNSLASQMTSTQTLYFGTGNSNKCNVCGRTHFASSTYPSNYGGAKWINGYLPFHSNVPGNGLTNVDSVDIVLNGLFGCYKSSRDAGPSLITVFLNGQSSGQKSVPGSCKPNSCTGCDHSPVFSFPGTSYVPGSENMLQVVVAKGNYAAITTATVKVGWTPFSTMVTRSEATLQSGGVSDSCYGACDGGMTKINPGDTLYWRTSNPMADWSTLLGVSVVFSGKMNCGAVGVKPKLDTMSTTPIAIPTPGVQELKTNWNNTIISSRWFFPGQGTSRCSFCYGGEESAVWDMKFTDKYVHQNFFDFTLHSDDGPYASQICNASVYFFYETGHPPTCYKNCSYPHGECINAQCVCKPPYFGLGCTEKHCKNNCTSPSQGTCNTENGECQCFPPYYGCDCSSQTKKCPNDCSGNGFCNIFSGECQCTAGKYSGDDCSTHLCPNNCGGECHGTCDTTSGKCTCKDPWYGDSCSKLALKCPMDCSGHGFCRKDTGTCECDKGYYGPGCNLVDVCPDNCNGNGQCDYSSGTCLCNPGYYGCSCNIAK
eukprot:TRINITY_DN4182_c0_g1_i1.p1 TRINITY_DN4182_c0_g1~~TRINITY_DN4182_c0_g1_i1.p1  ORF type:complete len:851 (-),score=143.83 TRINITY_DN4182_c0_g1_i1:1165-3717(-)